MSPGDDTTRGYAPSRLLPRACRWIEDRLGDFTLARWRGDAADEAFWASLKAIAELAHAGDFLVRTPDATSRVIGRAWLDRAWDQTERGAAIRRVLAADPRFLPVALTVIPFHLAGLRDAATLDVIRAQLPRTTMSALEWTFVVPALDILGIAAPAAGAQRAREHGILARRPPADTLPQDAAYILAHECFYATSWGHTEARLDAELARYVATALASLVERAIAARDADLLAELILATRTHRLAVDPRALDVVEEAQGPDGNVIPPPRLDTRHRRFVHPTMPRTYHTTLAAIMAWAC